MVLKNKRIVQESNSNICPLCGSTTLGVDTGIYGGSTVAPAATIFEEQYTSGWPAWEFNEKSKDMVESNWSHVKTKELQAIGIRAES